MADTSDSQKTDWQAIGRSLRRFQLAFVGVKAGLFPVIAGGPRTLQEIAALAKWDVVRLKRILNGFVWAGLTDCDPDGQYGLTGDGRALLDEGSLAPAAGILMEGTFFYQSWGALYDYLTTGAEPFPSTHSGVQAFDFLCADPRLSTIFSSAMADRTLEYASQIVSYEPIQSARTIIDVGGGAGALLIAILEELPKAQGAVFDLESLAPQAANAIAGAGLKGRCRFVGGDMFDGVPLKGDVYLLKWVLHDWNDEKAGLIFANCAAAMTDTSRLIVIERLMPDHVNGQSAGLVMSDLNMLCFNGGAERSLAEYQTLAQQSGLEIIAVLPFESQYGFHIMEMKKRDVLA